MAKELERMIDDAKSKGLGPESVDSVYLRGEEALLEHESRNGYNVEFGPTGVAMLPNDNKVQYIPEGSGMRHVLVR